MRFWTCLAAGALVLLSVRYSVQAEPGEKHRTIKSFAVGSDEDLSLPPNLVNFPDEHTTFIPLPLSHGNGVREADHQTYLVFGSGKILGETGGAAVLETDDLKHFYFAPERGYSDQVMQPPVSFTMCDPAYDSEFDENYSAPGSVVQDPTQPPDHLIMIYEAENHCPSGRHQQPFYATVGFARSSDGGRTWPPPANSEFGNDDRYPAVKAVDPEPPWQPDSINMGDALPSAFADGRDEGDAYLYVTYGYAAGPNRPKPTDGLIRVARARLGTDGRLPFFKFYNGAFSQPGVGGLDSGVLPTVGCTARQVMAEITHNDDLGLYVMVFVCNPSSKTVNPPKTFAAWYYSTATSLELQDWTKPQPILNSEFEITSPCNTHDDPPTGSSFEGFYPSFMTPGAPPGHTRLTGRAFSLTGCDTGLPRAFTSRPFVITTEP